ncbi:MAG: element excision factor XisI family protein [Microcystaceae cyanobacterium]
MANSINYGDILTKVLRKESKTKLLLKSLNLSAVCDQESGQFLIIMTGWEQEKWINTILFHARLSNGKIVIEDDNFEEGLTPLLIKAGIPSADILHELGK